MKNTTARLVKNIPQVSPIREIETTLHFDLWLENRGISLYAQLRDASGSLRWSVSSRPIEPQEVEEGTVVCNERLMEDACWILSRWNFAPTGSPGLFRMTDRWDLHSFLELGLPHFKGCYSVRLDGQLDCLLQGGRRPRIRAEFSDLPEPNYFGFFWQLEVDDRTLTSEGIRVLKGNGNPYCWVSEHQLIRVDPNWLKRQFGKLGDIGYVVENGGVQPIQMALLGTAVDLVVEQKSSFALNQSRPGAIRLSKKLRKAYEKAKRRNQGTLFDRTS